MTDLLQRFRDCTDPEQRELFTQTADQLSARPEQIEKDLWLCVLLDRVFHRSGILPSSTVFKGATSLTKTYDVIKRFSEDIDLAIHPAAFGFTGDTDPTDPANAFTPDTRRELRLALRDALRAFVIAELAPAIQSHLPHGCAITPQSQRGRTSHLEVRYPSLYPDNPLHTVVRIDLTATSLVAPYAHRDASAYVSRLFEDTWRIAPVPTLSPHQTFWEKVLVLHDARSRFDQRARFPRLRGRHLSRHYYDVAMISAHPVSALALDHPETLLRVRDHAQANSWKDYSSAEPGTLALIPPHTEGTASAQPSFRAFLEEDYRQMRPFIFGDAPSFDWIVSRLETIEATVNRTRSHERAPAHGQDLGMSF